MLACWHVDSAVNVEINYLKIPHLWRSLPLSWKIFPISWKICPNSRKSSPNKSIWAGLPWIWTNLPWNWKNHGMSHPLLPQHWHTLLQLIINCFHVGVTMAHDCTIAKSQRKLIGSWGRIVRMKFGREDSPMHVKKKCWMSWGRGLAVRKSLFTTCKLRTNSASEDECMLVRKKQCLEIKAIVVVEPVYMTRWARALDTGQWHWTSSPQAFVRYINKGGTYLFLQIILPFIHLDQMKYLLSRPPCWTPFSACPRVVTGQLLALWKGWPPLICESVLVEYHCELVTTVTPYDEIYQVGAAIALFCIIFGSSLGVQAQEPSEQGGEGAMRSTHDHWSALSLCLIENAIKKTLMATQHRQFHIQEWMDEGDMRGKK